MGETLTALTFFEQDGQRWYKLKEVCELLGLKNTTRVARGIKHGLSQNVRASGGGLLYANEKACHEIILRNFGSISEEKQVLILNLTLPIRNGNYQNAVDVTELQLTLPNGNSLKESDYQNAVDVTESSHQLPNSNVNCESVITSDFSDDKNATQNEVQSTELQFEVENSDENKASDSDGEGFNYLKYLYNLSDNNKPKPKPIPEPEPETEEEKAWYEEAGIPPWMGEIYKKQMVKFWTKERVYSKDDETIAETLGKMYEIFDYDGEKRSTNPYIRLMRLESAIGYHLSEEERIDKIKELVRDLEY